MTKKYMNILKTIYRFWRRFFQQKFPTVYNMINKYKQIVKYLISGGIATVTYLGVSFTLTEWARLWYLISVDLAFVTAFFVSFYLQKFWTFCNFEKEGARKQMLVYFIVGLINLGISTGGVYLLVEKMDIWYLLAQIIMGGFISFFSFLVYKFIIFKKVKFRAKDDKLNILIATGIYPPEIGGPATYTQTLQKELPKYGFKVKIITYGKEKNTDDVFYISSKQNILFRYFKYTKQVWKLIPWADVVYVQGPVSEGLPTYWACKLRNKEYILKVVGDYAWEQGRQRFGVQELLDDFSAQGARLSGRQGPASGEQNLNKRYNRQVRQMRKVQKKVAQGAKKIIVPSQYLKKILLNWDIKEQKIKVIYNATKKVEFSAKKEDVKNNLHLDGSIILSVGRLVPWKGFECLIKIMPELLEINPNFKLIIAGEGPDKHRLHFIAKNLELENKIKIIGSIPQDLLWKYMRAADIFILNTGYEGLPHVVLEAMQVGTPIITTNVCGNPEVIKNNKTGILVEYNNPQQIKDSILKLWRDKELGKHFVNNTKNDLGKFDHQKMIENTIKVLKENA